MGYFDDIIAPVEDFKPLDTQIQFEEIRKGIQEIRKDIEKIIISIKSTR